MKRIVIALACALMYACAATTKDIAFTEAHNYFCRNDRSLPRMQKITSEAQLLDNFGQAAFMGKDGEVTQVDFNKDFVIALTEPVTQTETSIMPEKLSETAEGKLQLDVKVNRGKKLSYSMQPCYLMIVPKKYADMDIVRVDK